MITYDGFKKITCGMDGNNIIIAGESYPVISIKETRIDKAGRTFVFVVVLLTTVFVAYLGYMGIQHEVINNNDSKHLMVNAFIWLLLFGILAYVLWAIVKFTFIDCSNCRSYWVINGKSVYVEQNDDKGIEQRFREIGFKLRASGIEETKAGLCGTSMNNKGKKVLLFVVIGSFYTLLALGLSNSLEDNIVMPLLFFVLTLIVIMRILSLKKDYDNLKWRK